MSSALCPAVFLWESQLSWSLQVVDGERESDGRRRGAESFVQRVVAAAARDRSPAIGAVNPEAQAGVVTRVLFVVVQDEARIVDRRARVGIDDEGIGNERRGQLQHRAVGLDRCA